MLKFLFYALFLLYFSKCKSCITSNISVSQTIENPGFHKLISWLVDFSFEPYENLKNLHGEFALYLKIPSGMYVNPDELAEMRRRGEIDARISGDVDIEAPEHLSREHDLWIFFSKEKKLVFPEEGGNLQVVSLPVHLRYQKATVGKQFTQVTLGKPSLLFHNLGQEELCGKWEELNLLCRNPKEGCTWKNISYKALFDESILLVPVGNLDHFPLVVIGTVLLGCVGCFYILSLIKTTKTKRE